MQKKSIFSILLTALTLLVSVSQVFASPLMEGALTETPTLPPNLATQRADMLATQQAGKLKGARAHFKGTVSASDLSSLTLTLSDGSSVTFSLDARTRVVYAAPKGARPGRLRSGDSAMVQALRTDQGGLVAMIVLVMPGKPTRAHHIGKVVEYVPGVSLTIQDRTGATHVFALGASTKIMPSERASLLAPGVQVTIIALRDPTGVNTAIGVVVLPSIP